MSASFSQQVVIYGLGSLAQLCAYLIKEDTDATTVAFTVSKEYLSGNERTLDGLPIIPFEELEEHYSAGSCSMFIAVGHNAARERLFHIVEKKGYDFFSYVSSKASTWPDLKVGRNVLVSDGAVIQPYVSIGDNCILFSPQIGHHCTIGNHCLLSCCFLAGNITIGNRVFLALTASIKQGLTIADDTIVGMGCSITHNTAMGDVYSTKCSTVKLSAEDAEITHKRYLS